MPDDKELEEQLEPEDEVEPGLELSDDEQLEESESEESKSEEPESEELSAAPAPISTPPYEPVRLPSVTPALGKTGDVIWGEQAKRPASDMNDLFDIPRDDDNDMYTDDLFEIDEEDIDLDDDLSDLTQVTNEDIMGRPPRSKQQQPARRRRDARYNSPTSMGGIQ